MHQPELGTALIPKAIKLRVPVLALGGVAWQPSHSNGEDVLKIAKSGSRRSRHGQDSSSSYGGVL
jgi:hypothetical protein